MSKKSVPESLPESLHPQQLIAAPVVCALRGCKRSKLYSDIKKGKFPPPDVVDGPRFSRWRVSTVLGA
jgi:predicted DNA-binding transcriptional regulator AlpA